MTIIASGKIAGVKSFVADFNHSWVTVDVNDLSTAPVRIGDTEEASKCGPWISQGSRCGWPISGKREVWIRTANAMPVDVCIRGWAHKMAAPNDVMRPVIGTTAKTLRDPIMLPADGTAVTIDQPSTGEFAASVMLDPKADGYARIGSNDTPGIWLYPGKLVHLPCWNGTLQARSFNESKDVEIAVLKHENGWMNE